MAPAVPLGFPNVMARDAVAQPAVFGPELVVVDAEVVVVVARVVVVVDDDELPQAASPRTVPARSNIAVPDRRRRPRRSARRAVAACARLSGSGAPPFGVTMIDSSFGARHVRQPPRDHRLMPHRRPTGRPTTGSLPDPWVGTNGPVEPYTGDRKAVSSYHRWGQRTHVLRSSTVPRRRRRGGTGHGVANARLVRCTARRRASSGRCTDHDRWTDATWQAPVGRIRATVPPTGPDLHGGAGRASRLPRALHGRPAGWCRGLHRRWLLRVPPRTSPGDRRTRDTRIRVPCISRRPTSGLFGDGHGTGVARPRHRTAVHERGRQPRIGPVHPALHRWPTPTGHPVAVAAPLRRSGHGRGGPFSYTT